MATSINSNGDGRSLSGIRHNLAVLKEKMRGLKEEICELYRRCEKGEMIIEQAKGKISIEKDTTNTRVVTGSKLVTFQKGHMSTCE